MKEENNLFQTVKKYFGWTLSEEQYQLLTALCKFYLDHNSNKLFVLKGYAGTGKTSLLSAFVKGLMSLKRKTILLAPTGRAAKVFSLKSDSLTHTIHKKIYRKEKMIGGGIYLGLAPNLHTNTLFLVDEASMIGDYTLLNNQSISARNLLEDLVNYVYNGKNCYLIFIGDTGQLPPVGSDFSPALNEAYLAEYFPQLQIDFFQLKHVLRQAENSDIVKNATLLRSAQRKRFPTFKLTDKGDVYRLNGRDLEDTIDSSYNHFDVTETLVITRSNKRANLFNQQIRSRIFWYEEDIVGNDILMVVRNNYFWLGNDSKMGFIANGEAVQVERVLKRETLYGFDFVDVRIRFIDYPKHAVIEVKIMLEVLYAETPNLSRNRMKELFFAVEQEYLYERNKNKRYELIMNNPYFNALQVKYAYAVTCHKSQGGQWKSVFIDQGYLTEDILDANFFRWLYTAFTRATEQLYLVNFNTLFFEEES